MEYGMKICGHRLGSTGETMLIQESVYPLPLLFKQRSGSLWLHREHLQSFISRSGSNTIAFHAIHLETRIVENPTWLNLGVSTSKDIEHAGGAMADALKWLSHSLGIDGDENQSHICWRLLSTRRNGINNPLGSSVLLQDWNKKTMANGCCYKELIKDSWTCMGRDGRVQIAAAIPGAWD
jgi:hypothetical protein